MALSYLNWESFAGVAIDTFEGLNLTTRIGYDFNSARFDGVPLAGADGAFDLYSTTPAPKEAGIVRITANPAGVTSAAAWGQFRNFMSQYTQGLQQLVVSTPEASEGNIYCMARVSNITFDGSFFRPETIVPIDFEFFVPTPIWLSVDTTTTTINASGSSTSGIIANAGNAITIPTITITTPSNANGINVKRQILGIDQDNITYAAGSISGADTIVYNPMADSFTLNGGDIYNDVFNSFLDVGAVYRLLPSDNTAVIELTSGAADVEFTYRAAYT